MVDKAAYMETNSQVFNFAYDVIGESVMPQHMSPVLSAKVRKISSQKLMQYK